MQRILNDLMEKDEGYRAEMDDWCAWLAAQGLKKKEEIIAVINTIKE